MLIMFDFTSPARWHKNVGNILTIWHFSYKADTLENTPICDDVSTLCVFLFPPKKFNNSPSIQLNF